MLDVALTLSPLPLNATHVSPVPPCSQSEQVLNNIDLKSDETGICDLATTKTPQVNDKDHTRHTLHPTPHAPHTQSHVCAFNTTMHAYIRC